MADTPDEATLIDQLINQINDNIYFKDREGHFILINQEGAKRAGCRSPDELIGKTDQDIFTEEHSHEALEDEQRIIETGRPLYGKEEKETWEDGHETWVSTTKMPLRSFSGEVVGTFGISRDITLHKKAEMRAARYAEENRRLCDELEGELQMAAELQKTFLPRSYPVFPEAVDPAESAARFCHYYHSISAVGGDFCSVRKLSETEAGILMCDVTGHGVRSALVTAMIRSIVEQISQSEHDPGRFLQHMNALLKPITQQEDLFISSTACYLILDLSTGRIRYAIAGHPVPILLNSEMKCAEWLTDNPEDSGPALGVHPDPTYQTLSRHLNPGDAIVMYTDSLCQATDQSGKEFGRARLLELADRCRKQRLTEAFPNIVNEVQAYAGSSGLEDDACLVGCRFAHRLNVQTVLPRNSDG